MTLISSTFYLWVVLEPQKGLYQPNLREDPTEIGQEVEKLLLRKLAVLPKKRK